MAIASRLAGFALMWAALLGFVIVELQPLTHLLWSRWHAVYVGEQWEYSSEPIPRVLHQTWKTHEPPPELLGYIESWHVQNPHLEYMLWNDTEGLGLIETHYPWFYRHMDAFKTGVEKADIIRYFILYHYGGIYADLDMEAVRPIEPLLTMHDDSFGVALGSEPFDHAQNQGSRNMLVCNAMMVSQPKHPFWEAVFRALLEQVPRLKAARAGGEDLSPVDTTGPVLLTKIFEKHPDAFMDVMVYPSNVFYPYKDDESKYKPIDPSRDRFAGTYAAHRWHHLWFGRHRHTKKKPWERKIDKEIADWQAPDQGGQWQEPGMHGHHGMHGGWGGPGMGWNDRRGGGMGTMGNPPDNGVWQNGGVWQPAEPNGGGRFNAIKRKRLVPRPTVGGQIVGTKLMFFTQVLVDESEYLPHAVFSTGCAGANETNIVVNIAANYKLPKKASSEPPPPTDGEAQEPPPPEPPPPPATPEEVASALARSGLPLSTRLHVAGVTRHAENAPADFRGVGDSDFAPMKRGRVELGGSTTGSASFAIEFEGEIMSGEPIILAQARYPSNEGFHHPEMMDSFGVELTDVRADGFAVNVARLDKLDNSGWAQMLRLDYMAWLPTPKPKSSEDRAALAALSYRSGISKAGHTHKHKKVKGEPRSVRVHIPFDPPLLFPIGSEPGLYGAPQVVATMCGEAGQSFPDVHAVVVHDIDAHGFNATVLRVDDLGHGWMSNIQVHWMAWLPRLRAAPTLAKAPSEEGSVTNETEVKRSTTRLEGKKTASEPAEKSGSSSSGGGGGGKPRKGAEGAKAKAEAAEEKPQHEPAEMPETQQQQHKPSHGSHDSSAKAAAPETPAAKTASVKATVPAAAGAGAAAAGAAGAAAAAGSATDTAAVKEHVHTRGSLPTPSQSVHVFADVAKPTAGGDDGGGHVVHVHGTSITDAKEGMEKAESDFDHLPELPDPTKTAGAAPPGFLADGLAAAAAAAGEHGGSETERKWDFVATAKKPPAAAAADATAAAAAAGRQKGAGGGRRRALKVVDE